MRIAIYGATGRVGTKLVEGVLRTPGVSLAAALVSPESPALGKQVAGTGIEFRAATPTMRDVCDVIIDFSNPDASLALQEIIGEARLPVVIGTTGFSEGQDARLTQYARKRPMLISANFAHGFEAFEQAVLRFAAAMPGADPRVIETYHLRKAAKPSGTSQRMAQKLRAVRTEAMGFDAPEVPITVNREADVVGIQEVLFTLGSGTLNFSYNVESLSAYADGALEAALWLLRNSPDNGRYALADSIQS